MAATDAHVPPGTDARAPSRVLDVRVLEGIVGSEPDAVARFLRDFLGYAACWSEEMRQAAGSARWSVVHLLAHRLKSSSRSVGALELGDLCQRLEDAGATSCATRVPDLMHRLDLALEAVRAAVAARG